jgi:hypothetical protein
MPCRHPQSVMSLQRFSFSQAKWNWNVGKLVLVSHCTLTHHAILIYHTGLNFGLHEKGIYTLAEQILSSQGLCSVKSVHQKVVCDETIQTADMATPTSITVVFTEAVSSSDCRIKWLVNNEWKGFGRKLTLPNLKYHHNVCLEWPRKRIKNLSGQQVLGLASELETSQMQNRNIYSLHYKCQYEWLLPSGAHLCREQSKGQNM